MPRSSILPGRLRRHPRVRAREQRGRRDSRRESRRLAGRMRGRMRPALGRDRLVWRRPRRRGCRAGAPAAARAARVRHPSRSRGPWRRARAGRRPARPRMRVAALRLATLARPTWARLAEELLRERERRHPLAHSVEHAGARALLGGLRGVPVHEHLLGRVRDGVAEDMRMPSHHLLGEAACDVVDVERLVRRRARRSRRGTAPARAGRRAPRGARRGSPPRRRRSARRSPRRGTARARGGRSAASRRSGRARRASSPRPRGAGRQAKRCPSSR